MILNDSQCFMSIAHVATLRVHIFNQTTGTGEICQSTKRIPQFSA